MQHTAEYWIDALKLVRHPEGGYFAQSYACGETVSVGELHAGSGSERPLATSIYFLLSKGEASRFHRLKSDEVWYYHAGSPLTIYCIMPEGELKEKKLGLDVGRGEAPQVVVPAGTIFGATPDGDGCSLSGCMVSPGFDYADFELLDKDILLERYPQHKAIVERLT